MKERLIEKKKEKIVKMFVTLLKSKFHFFFSHYENHDFFKLSNKKISIKQI